MEKREVGAKIDIGRRRKINGGGPDRAEKEGDET